MQDPEERVHLVPENVPVPLLVHSTVPVGDSPVTVAVHLEAAPKTTGEGEQVTEVPGVEA